MKVWVVDGHNVIGAVPALASRWDADHEGIREELRRRCADFALGRRGKVVLVFDGESASRSPGARVEVHYSRHADPVVAAQAEALSGPHQVTVVTADRGILDRVPRGVKRLPPERFWALLSGTGSKSGAARKQKGGSEKQAFHDPELEAHFLDAEADALRDLPPSKPPKKTPRPDADYRRAAAEGKTKPRDEDDFTGPAPPARRRKRNRRRR
jgi:predicted RNA-binding protein with PIN domain